MTLGERMLLYRARENISQTELANRCRVTKQTIYNVENGVQNPSKLTKTKIELVIGQEGKEK